MVLRSFMVSNWKSYYDSVEITMMATRERKHGECLARVGRGRILPVGAIYGANAAGKSTLVEALSALRSIIVGARRPGAALPVIPHLPEGREEPSSFSIEFLVTLGGVGKTSREAVLVYELAADRRRIHREVLLVRHGSREVFLFERKDNTVEVDSELEENPRIRSHAAVIAPNETLLGAVGSDPLAEQPHVQAAYGWFAKQLNIIYPDSEFVYLPSRFDADDLFAGAMNAGLTRADTGITGLVLEEVKLEALPLEAEQIEHLVDQLADNGGSFIIGGAASDYAVLDYHDGQPRARRLAAKHTFSTSPETEPVAFKIPLREESKGTQRFMNLLPVLFQLREEDSRSVFVIDELENSMHPKLTEDFIRCFLEDLDESNRRQLIFTTHEVQLMRSDLLRRDEIWLAEKQGGQSQLTRVSDYSGIGVRKDADLLSFYMSGRLGGVPRI